jgi:hypothetical protein
METVKLKAHIGEDGMLKLAVPTRFSGEDVEVVLVMHSGGVQAETGLGWPAGFFDRTYGALADDPVERPAQLPVETRESLE